MTRGEIYRTRDRVPERGGKPGFYVVVSRAFVAGNTDVSTLICAAVYSEILGLETEVVLGPEEGRPRVCAVRCDFLTLMFKQRLTDFIATRTSAKIGALDRALVSSLSVCTEKPAPAIDSFNLESHSRTALDLISSHLSSPPRA